MTGLPHANEYPPVDSSASMVRHIPIERSWLPDSYMMMPHLLSGKPGGSSADSAYTRPGPTRSPSHVQLPSNQEMSPSASLRGNQNSQQMLHPIILIFQQQELGRHVLVLAIPMAIALVTLLNPVNAPLPIRLTAVALSVGVAAIWNGILLRETCLKASKWIELLGVAFMFLAFYGFIGIALPNKTLIWIPAL